MSSDLNHIENGHSKPTNGHSKPLIFDAPAEDSPLLEPLIDNLPSSLVGSSIPEDSSAPPPAPPHDRSPGKGTFTHDKQEVQRKKKRVVHYDSDSHIRVLFQMHGSVWPNVLPYCLVAVALTYLIAYLQNHKIVDLTFATSNGHNFMAIMVSFLVVTRANITYARFMEARNHLTTCYRCCREVNQHAAVLTLQDDSLGGKNWRQAVAFRSILLLRVTMAAIEYRSSSVNTWDVLGRDEDMELLTPTPTSRSRYSRPTHHRRHTSSIVDATFMTPQMEKISNWAHGERTMMDENFRAPIVLTYNLRQTIMENRNHLVKALQVNEELKIMGFVSDYVTAFHGLKKLITTPFPFPLVQMCRTFLFFWVFTLPLVLVNALDSTGSVMAIMFFVTYGFLGLEYVSMELDDPFGDDPNDFDDLGMAEIVFEDIYITIFKRDGTESAEQLRDKVVKRELKGDALKNYHSNLERAAF